MLDRVGRRAVPAAPMSVVSELRAAAALSAGRSGLVATDPVRERAAALAWLPLAGLAIGATAAVGAALGATVARPVGAVLGALVLAAARGEAAGRPLALVAGAVEAAALVLAPRATWTTALVASAMLARWACVVQCYGGTAGAGATGVAALAGRAQFREFAIASVTALGAMLGLLDAVGLGVAVASALVTLAVRVVAYRRGGGLDDGALRTTSALVETSALVLLAWIGSVLGPR